MINNMSLALKVLAIFGSFSSCWSACTYPSNLIGEWYSTSFGTLNFITNQSFTGFTSSISSAPLTFTCFESSGSQYVSMSSYTLFGNIVVDAYLCMNLQEISSIKYYFTLDNNLDSFTGVRFYTASQGDTVSLSQACSRSDTRTAGEYELLIKKDQLTSAVTSCPGELQSTFNVTMTTSSTTECADSQMEGSTGALVFNYSSCATGQLNNGGYLQCLYSKTDLYGYATLYNNDTNTDESSTYLFSCLTFQKDAEILKATESPNSCHVSQTPTTVNSTGVIYDMTDLLYTPPEEKKDYTLIIIIVCVIVGAIIIVVIVLVILYIKVWRKPAPVPPPKIRKRKKQLSITEYTPRSLGRASSVEKLDKDGIKRISTEEIISGLDSGKSDKTVEVNGKAYVPTKKEAWQKKWEKDQSRTSPRLTQETLKRMRQSFPSDSGISRFDELYDLDKAYTLSTSLPDSIDIPFKDGPRVFNQTDKKEEPIQTSVIPKYTEKLHASPSIPASTGKFGNSPIMRSVESIPMPGKDSKLDTIKENPLSRENTLLSQKGRISSPKKLREHPNLTRIVNGGDVTALSTVLTSHSTASGWQYKWESVMRPTKVISTTEHHIQRSQTPVNLFQNVKLEEPSCISNKNKVTFKQNKSTSDHYHMSESLSESQNETNSFDDFDNAGNSVNSSTIEWNDMKQCQINTSTSDVSYKATFTIENEKECKSDSLFKTTALKNLKKAYSNKVSPMNDTVPAKNHEILSNDQSKPFDNDSKIKLDYNNDGGNDTDDKDQDNDVISLAMTDITNDCADLYSGIDKFGSIRTLEHIEYDTISLHTELFFPEDWLYEDDATIDQIWKKGTKRRSSMNKREYKHYLEVDDEVARKKEISPFKKMKTEI